MQLPVNRASAGGRGPSPNIWGPMFVIEAVGGDRFPPKVEPGPDPSGVQSLHWPGRCARQEARSELAAWAIRREPRVSFPAGQWSNATWSSMHRQR